MKKWKIIKSKVAYNHPFFKVREDRVELSNGKELPDFTVWDHSDVVQVVPITKDGFFVMVEMYKHGLGKIIREFPGGFVESGENPELAAKRELAEETGLVAEKVTKIGTFSHHPTKENGLLHLYVMEGCHAENTGHHLDETEDIVVHRMTSEEVMDYFYKTEVIQSGSYIGFLSFLAKKNYESFL